MVVVGIIGVCLAVVIAVSPSFIKGAKADGGANQALEVIRSARDTAISQRRNIQLVFVGTNEIQVIREDIGATGLVTGTTTLRTVQLENRTRFLLVSGVPDTPDLFGRTAPASFSSTTRFSTEGTFMDANGDPMNGTLFMAIPNELNTARAITFFGATALVRLWRWNGSQWVE
jgi:type II secretory pathway pseudopilin PulG